VRSIAFSPDGKYLVAVGEGEIAKIWNVETGKKVLELVYKNALLIYRVAYASSGKYIAASTGDGFILWDAQSGKALYTFVGESPDITGGRFDLRFTPDGRYLLVYDGQGAFSWDIETYKKVHSFLHWVGVEQHLPVDLSSNGKYVLTNGGYGVWLWDFETGETIHKFEFKEGLPVRLDGTFLPDGQSVLLKAVNGEKIGLDVTNIWDINAQKYTQMADTMGSELEVFSSDGKYVLFLSYAVDGVVQVWDIHLTKKLLEVTPLPTGGVFGAFLPDSKRIILPSDQVRDEADTYDVWNVEQGIKELSFRKTDQSISLLVSSPNGKYIAVANDTVLQLWDSKTLETLRDFC
jgi:WD40 repeat protein